MKKMIKPLKNGEPWELEDGVATVNTCCDCGLAHQIFVDIKGKKVFLRFYRDTWQTTENRKTDKIIIYRKKKSNKEG